MHAIRLNIEDSIYSKFMNYLGTLPKGSVEFEKLEEDNYDYASHCPPELIVSSVEEVRRRVYEAEQQNGLTEEEYEIFMNKAFKEELGIAR